MPAEEEAWAGDGSSRRRFSSGARSGRRGAGRRRGDGRGQPVPARRRALDRRRGDARRAGLPRQAARGQAELCRRPGGVRPRHARRGQAVRRGSGPLPGEPGRARPAVADPRSRLPRPGADGDRPDPGRRASTSSSPCSGRGARGCSIRPGCPRRPPGGPGAPSPPRSPTIPASCSRSSTSRAIGHASRKDWQTWKAGMQPLIDLLRRQGSKNVLLVGGVQYSRSFENAPALDDPLGQLGYAVHPFLGEYNQTRADWQKKFGDFAETHPVMATAFNAQAGGRYCRPELPEQAAALLAYLHEKRIGLVAWALDMPSLREADGSYTTLDHLVCGERRDGGTRRRRRDDPRLLHGQLMAAAADGLGRHPGLERRRDARSRPWPRSGRRASGTGSSSSSTTPRATARRRSSGRSPPPIRGSGRSRCPRTAARRRRATPASAPPPAATSPLSTPTTSGGRRSSPASSPSCASAATPWSSPPTAASPPTAGRSASCGRRRGSTAPISSRATSSAA